MGATTPRDGEFACPLVVFSPFLLPPRLSLASSSHLLSPSPLSFYPLLLSSFVSLIWPPFSPFPSLLFSSSPFLSIFTSVLVKCSLPPFPSSPPSPFSVLPPDLLPCVSSAHWHCRLHRRCQSRMQKERAAVMVTLPHPPASSPISRLRSETRKRSVSNAVWLAYLLCDVVYIDWPAGVQAVGGHRPNSVERDHCRPGGNAQLTHAILRHSARR